jgi:rhodanese-related sulfurtransferase
VTAREIEREEIKHLMHEGAQVLDALPPDDYKRQHIAGAINVPIERFSPELLGDLDPEKPTITYCADNECDLSARLAARLVLEGFTDVREFAKSLADWTAFGLPIEGAEAENATAGDLAQTEFETCSPDEPAAEVAQRIGDRLCVVVNEDGALLGRVKAEQLNDGEKVRDVMDAGPSTFRPDVPLIEMADWFEKRPKIEAFIITTPDARPYGVLYRADVEHAAGQAEERRTAAAARR